MQIDASEKLELPACPVGMQNTQQAIKHALHADKGERVPITFSSFPLIIVYATAIVCNGYIPPRVRISFSF
jgi:hypothetical protein